MEGFDKLYEEQKTRKDDGKDVLRFGEAELNKFFNTPVWKEIQALLLYRRATVLGSLTSFESSHETDLICKAILRENSFMLNLRELLTKENPDDYQEEPDVV